MPVATRRPLSSRAFVHFGVNNSTFAPGDESLPCTLVQCSVLSWGSIETVPQQASLHHDCNGLQLPVQCKSMIPSSRSDANVYAGKQLSHIVTLATCSQTTPCA